MKYTANVNGKDFEVELLSEKQVAVDGKLYEVDLGLVEGQRIYSLLVNGQSFDALILSENGTLNVLIQGVLYTVEALDEREKRLRDASGRSAMVSGEFQLTAPMPGLVVKVPVSVGDVVEAGDVLVILESMKMQNELKSPRLGRVAEVNVSAGVNVEKRDVMVVLAPQIDED